MFALRGRVGGSRWRRGCVLPGVMLTLLAICLGPLVAGASGAGAAQGPPAGPTSPPFYQCPAIGLDTTCQFLVDVSSTNPAVAPTVIEDSAQSYYDGSDDVTVAIQNDSSAPLSSVHLGVSGSGDSSFAFDGDGLCSPPSGPAPDDCPFGPPGNNEDPFDYFGPDTVLQADAGTQDAGNVDFNTPLQPGQYTYISLEAPLSTPVIYAGTGNTGIQTTLTDTTEGSTVEPAAVIKTPAPAAITDTATIVGPNASTSTGSVTYKVYSDSLCQKAVGNGGSKTVTNGLAETSDEVGIAPRALANNATYFWQATYNGDGANSPVKSACGNETMTFGTPPALPAPAVSTSLTGGGLSGAKITVPAGTAVTDNATVSPPSGQAVSGRMSYEVYSGEGCSQSTQVRGAGGGLIAGGSAPASSALSLSPGTYYFQASYSGNGILAPAVSPCGSEVLTVLAASPAPPPPPPPPPPLPSSQFISVGSPKVNSKTGQIVLIGQFSAAGTETATATVTHGATLARFLGAPAEIAKRSKSNKCKHGFVKKKRKCVNNGPVTYGSATSTIPGAGTYSIVISPSGKVLKSLKSGKRLNVLVSTTFQNRAGGVPVTHVQNVSVKLKKPRKHRKH